MAVLQTTGPIPYTQAIMPLLKKEKYREFEYDEMIGLIYNNIDEDHTKLFSKPHYTLIREPLIIT